jgi:putative hydrolase of the HAD superfamily
LHRIRAISLDLDDTLWDIGPVIRRAEKELWQWLERHYPRIPATFTPDLSLALREQVISEHPHMAHDFRFLRKKVLTTMAETVDYPDDFVAEAFAVFDAARNRVELYPDVEPVLRELSLHFRVIAVTNGNANLETIGIHGLFHAVITAADVGVAKPQAKIFETAVREAGVEPEQVLHVGDHPEADVVGAIDAGLKTAWMNRSGAKWPEHLPAPDATVSSVTELRDLLAAAMRGMN